MKTMHAKRQLLGPGRCHCCGRLMIIARLSDPILEGDAPRSIGWRCLVCGRTVGLEAMNRRQEELLAWPIVARKALTSRHQGIEARA
jgi:hypothetical protein